MISELIWRAAQRIQHALSTWSLSVRFAVASLLVFLLLGLGLAVLLGSAVQGVALSEARQTAYDDLHSRLVDQIPQQQLLSGRMSPATYERFDRFVRHGVLSDRTVRVKVWTRYGSVLYSNDRRIVGRAFPVSDELERALAGSLASEVSVLSKSENADDRRFGKLLEVYIPIRYRPGGTVSGAFEIYESYAPVGREIGSLQRTVYGLLAAGLGLLYALLFGIVHRASSTIARQQKRLVRQAMYDDLTGLPSRGNFYESVRRVAAEGSTAGVLLMDLDRFKEVNDTFGHQYGDLLLREFGARLKSVLQGDETVARLGGDEFGVLLPGASETKSIEVARRIGAVLESPLQLQTQSLQVSASIGMALCPDQGTDPILLLQRADVAMYQAKRLGSGFAVYAPENDEYSPDRLALIHDLRLAIESGDIGLAYQPKVQIKTGEICGVEALARWEHPRRGQISPDVFIPLAEHTGLIRSLTITLLERAIRQSREWLDAGVELRVAVNLSARSLHDHQLVSVIAELLQHYRMQPDLLELEVTETALVADTINGSDVLRHLRGMGMRIAIDDFGTGYSSLSYLRNLPVDELKIDRSFIENVSSSDGDEAIVRLVTDLAHSLGLTVVAEGVEDGQALQLLARLGCDEAQGFYLSKPLSADRVAALFLDSERAAV